jgi:hypothetical protein
MSSASADRTSTAETQHVDVETSSAPPASPRGPRKKRRSQHWLARTYRKHFRPIFSRRLSRLAALIVPYLYLGYMRLVWATSRIDGASEFGELMRLTERHDGAVSLLWHEEVMTVAFGYPYVGVRGHTLASVGESGEVIARMLQMCGYVVFRGGSSTGAARRREGALRDMIDHMRTHRNVLYGLTVDGSKGPPYRMKTGGIVIARDCGKPIALVRTWYKRCVRLRTWDRMAVPLPFNVIRYYLRGPYRVPESAWTDEGLAAFRLELENDLIDLAAQSYADMGHERPANLVKR